MAKKSAQHGRTTTLFPSFVLILTQAKSLVTAVPCVGRCLRSNSRGMTLIEVLIAVAVLGLIGAAFMSGLTTSYKAVAIGGERTNAESLTRSEMEYIKDSPYWPFGFSYEIPATPDDPPPWDPTRTALESHYAGYSVKVVGQPVATDAAHAPLAPGLDNGMQEITVEVYLQDKLVLTTSSYKVNR